MKLAYVPLLLLLATFVLDCRAQNVSALIAEVEETVTALADRARQAYSNRCKNLDQCGCLPGSCSYDTSEGSTCTDLFPPDTVCQSVDSTCTRVVLDTEQPFQRLPAEEIKPDGTPNFAKELFVRDDLCAFGSGMKEAYADVCDDSSLVAKCFSGAARSGAFVIHPGQQLPRAGKTFRECSTYDPRRRPWFVAGSSGPKDVVFVLDTSASMLGESGVPGETRLDLVKRATLNLMDTFSSTDRVAIVAFNSVGRVLGENRMIVANGSEAVVELRAEVERLDAEEDTNFRAGFKEAFKLLTSSDSEGDTGSRRDGGCAKVILFLTDGRDTSPVCVDQEAPRVCHKTIIDEIDKLQSDLEKETGQTATINTYSMSNDADESLERQIACMPASHGIARVIRDGEDPLEILTDYYGSQALAYQKANAESVLWAAPYQDFGGLGLITTAVLPIFHSGGALIGVVGADVELNGALRDSELLFQRTVERCTGVRSELGACELQSLRGDLECVATYPGARDGCFTTNDRPEVIFLPIENVSLTWAEAASFCVDQFSGTLARVESTTEDALLASHVPPDGSWIGLTAESVKAPFRWQDGSSLDYSSWGFQEPVRVNEESSAEFKCGAIDNRGVRNNWFADSCSAKRAFVCEIPASNGCPFDSNINYSDLVKSDFDVPPRSFCENADTELKPCEGAETEIGGFCSTDGLDDRDANDVARRCCGEDGTGGSEGRCNVALGDISDTVESTSGLGIGVIVGIVVGVILALAVAVVAVILIVRARRASDAKTESTLSLPESDTMGPTFDSLPLA